jgi:hypothetical protein
VATACLVLGGCGSDPSDVVSETAAKLGEIRSGTLSMRVVMGGAEEAGGGDVGFELRGPFSLPEASRLPVAHIEYTQIAGPERGEAAFISTGDAAFVEVEGTTYELPEEQIEGLRAPEDDASGIEVFGDLEVDQWIVDPEATEGGEVGGAETDRVSGELDVVTALNDLLEVAGQFGPSGFGGLSQVEGDSAEQLENAVESATIDIYSGTEDGLLRRVDIDVEFGASGSGEVSDQVAELLGTRLTFEMTISGPNEPVEVEEPADAVPYPGG